MLVLVAVLGWFGAAVGLAGLALRWTDPGPQLLVVLTSGAWVLAGAPVLALVLQLIARSWIGVVVAVVVCAVELVVYLPLVRGTSAPDGGATVRVLTQNLLLGAADAQAVVETVERERVDVVFLQELTPAAQDALGGAGLDAALPHRWTTPDRSAFGAGIWSRFPLTGTQDYPGFMTATLSATATLPGGATVGLVCVHPPAPWPRPPERWRADLVALRTVLRALPTGPVLVGGDFNATVDHLPFRRLLDDGYRDAAEQAGAGVLRTWPADRWWPPMLGLDHVLTRGAVATAVGTVRTPGTDHRGLVATVVVPR